MASSAITAELALEIKGFLEGIKRAQDSARSFAKDSSRDAGALGGAFSGAAKGFGAVAVAGAKAAGIIGAAFTAIAGVVGANFLKGAASSAADFEQLGVTLDTFTGSAEKTKEILDEVAQFGVVTPFETAGLENTVKNFLSAGIAVEDVTALMKETAAVAKDTAQVEELGDALSKGFAKGKFQTEELNKFLERGINLMPTLAAVTGKSGDALTKAIEGGLKFDDVREAIAMMSREGGLFYGMLEKQSTTTNGLVSTLKGNFEEFRRQFGKPINDALKPLLNQAIALSGNLAERAGEWGARFVGALQAIGATVRAAVQVFSSMPAAEVAGLFVSALKVGFGEAVNFLFKGGAAAFSAIVAYFIEGIKNTMALLGILTTSGFWVGMLNAFIGIAQIFAGILAKRISQIITAIKEATGPIGKKILGDSDETFAAQGDTLMKSGKGALAQSGQDLAPAFEKIGERMRATGTAMSDAFKNTFSKATDVIDTSKDKGALAKVAGEIASVSRELRAKPVEATAPGAAPGAAPATPGAVGPGAVGDSLPALNSRIAGALNVISGRSSSAIIAAEASKTSHNTERTAKATEEIAKKMGSGSSTTPQPKPQGAAGRFA